MRTAAHGDAAASAPGSGTLGPFERTSSQAVAFGEMSVQNRRRLDVEGFRPYQPRAFDVETAQGLRGASVVGVGGQLGAQWDAAAVVGVIKRGQQSADG